VVDGQREVVSLMAEPKTGAGIRKWLSKKMGNPLIRSDEAEQIRQLEEEERLRDRAGKQERGEDYPASDHYRKPVKES
jgi:hypothetical protein